MADIEVVVKDRIGIVTLNRPDRRNAITLSMWRAIATIFVELGSDREIRAVVLTGAGGNFSVGADISEFATVRANASQSIEYEISVDAASEAIATTPKPVIAAVSGYCLGGGCHLSLACDFRMLRPDAITGIPAARLSIVYGVRSTKRLLSLVGPMQAKNLLFSAKNIDAETALKIGLATAVSEDPLLLALDYASGIVPNAPLSISGAKYIIDGLAMGDGSLDPTEAQHVIDFASRSEDYLEGRKAFTEKRAAVFKGR